MSRIYLFLLTLFLFPQSFLTQENLPFLNDRYSGISSATISPTQPFLNQNPWDINLISEDVFLQNDYAYISQQSFLGLGNSEIKSASRKKNITGENTAGVLDFYNADFGTYHFSSDILGPSLSINTLIKEKKFSLGLFTRLRTQTSAIKVDNYLKYGNQGLLEPELYFQKPLEINLMNWADLGFNFATEIFPYSDKHWIIGGNLKYEVGFDALNVKSKSELQIRRSSEIIDAVDTKTISVENFDVKANFASNYNFDSEKYEFKQKGKGFGVDLGIAVVDQTEGEEDYNFKASFNILDFGRINFKGEQHSFKGNSLIVVNNPELDNVKFDTPRKYFQLLSEQIYGDKNTSLQGDSFQMGLPTSLALNVSKNTGPNQYLSADLIQRIPVFKNSLRRSNILSASYTVQKPVLGYGASMSLYEYRSLQFGGYIRIGPLILGSSNVLPLLFKQKKLHSGDFFIGLKIYPFWDNEMKRHRRDDCNCD